jgi:ABC-type multidrug transport system permease subunit
MFPVLFLSGVFIPFSNTTPAWITWVARVFPVKHFVDGMQSGIFATPFSWSDLLIVVSWGVVGLLAVRFFRWERST